LSKIGNTKGSVGMTTLAVQVAFARRRDVLLIDADRLGAAQNAARRWRRSPHWLAMCLIARR
jgi:cellulose biosynthesis protein BcsQ